MRLADDTQHTATRLADAARDGHWNTVFAILDTDDGFVNLSRPGGKSGFTPMHPSVDTSNPATDRHRKTGHHASELRLVSGMR